MNKHRSTGSLRTLVYFFITEAMLTDIHSKGCLLTTMVHRAYRLLSTPAALADECSKLCFIFLNLDYPFNLINSSINKFLHNIDNIDAPKMQVTTPLLSWFNYHLKIRIRLIQSKDKCRIWAPTLVSSLNLSSRARRLAKYYLWQRRSPLLLAINAWFTNFSVKYTTWHSHQRIGEN